jgi:molybdenum cofactor cytidylyltransferase
MSISPENIEAVVLAAGWSSRAGAFKPAMDLLGKSVIARCIEEMQGLCMRIIVVGGYRIADLREAVKDVENVEVIANPRFPEGMFTSVKEGLRHLRGRRVFITPADHPLIQKDVYLQLLASGLDPVVPAYHGEKGHPVLMSAALAKKVLDEPDISTLKDFLERHDCMSVDVNDPGILWDLDTPEDAGKMLEELIRRGTAP